MINKIVINKEFRTKGIFILLLIGMALYYNYHQSMFARPQSVHAWRQADCASVTLNYYQDGMKFFHPEVHNQTSDGGTTGYCATSETPILYYFTAILYKLFGPHEFFLRAINTFIYLLSLFYCFKLFLYIIKDSFWAMGLSFLFFTSPLLVYYGNSYITNASSFSFVLIGWYYIIRYLKENKKRLLTLALVFFLLAGAFKITSLMSLIAICGYFLYEQFFTYKNSEKPFLIKHSALFVLGGVVIFSVILAWTIYAHLYNKEHDCSYFSTTVFPIWTLSFEKIVELLKHVKNYWLKDYFHFSALLFFFLLFVYVVKNYRKLQKHYIVFFILILFQSTLFIALQFWTFYHHDYYLINQFIVLFFIVVMSLTLFAESSKMIKQSLLIKIIFSLFLLFNIYYTKASVETRYTGSKNNYLKKHYGIYSISSYLDSIGISNKDKIIYLPDGQNVSLYLMNKKGWTQYTDQHFNRGEPTYYNIDSLGIQSSVSRGAKYLIVNSLADYYLYPYIKSYATNLAGTYRNTLIFNLTDSANNFKPKEPQLKYSIFCNAESVIDNKFSTSIDSLSFENGLTQSTAIAYEGKYSSELTPHRPFGMTFSTFVKDYGESFIVRVWRYGNKDSGIIVSGSAKSNFYLNNWKIINTDSITGWQLIETVFFTPSNTVGEEIKIYLYNPQDSSCYFDNMEIECYNPPQLK